MTPARTVLVTGGAGGIGRAIATAFHARGDAVVLTDIHGVDETAAELGVRGLTVDITDEDSVTRALDEVGPVDVLVNNAGLLTVHGSLLELPAGDMARILHTNVYGTFLMTQLVGRRMVERGAGGAIVNLSSIGGRQPTPGMGGYESSKAAVDALTRWSAIELAAQGIRVNAVAPGPVLTPMLAMGMPEGSPAREAWTSRIPLRRLAPVEQVAAAVVFLAGDEAAHITGVSLPVDGGQLLV
ncbi:SDR family NAD(P)-dependent oxidoreductase [Actinokineospora enzanensis]|uniref:SDR family NAD(P)-dependent oxidoreductase n=1 Tax=Actinokineospora enzanensis TaxID=155975 RepID=UPI00037ABF69|nr:SDR family oxidoreductase [Actinokineospora enzanensis]